MNTFSDHVERRRYFRHPVDVPIQVFLNQEQEECTVDLGQGGMAFITNVRIEKGTVITIRIPFVSPPFEVNCVVCWQQEIAGYFETGVAFRDKETAFRARMVEQVCHIKAYHEKQKQQGRLLTFEQSASEWINRYAADFGRNASGS